ncbi:hypothetical protein M1N58_02035 [Dehalococcoidales bacterium]|nr:hypothetical protein [Dehalococcoidales bacterium]
MNGSLARLSRLRYYFTSHDYHRRQCRYIGRKIFIDPLAARVSFPLLAASGFG